MPGFPRHPRLSCHVAHTRMAYSDGMTTACRTRHVEPRHVEPRHVEPRHVEPRHVEVTHASSIEAQREELRQTAAGTLQTQDTRVSDRRAVPEGEELVVDGYGQTHDGLIRSVSKGGFVFVMLTVLERHAGGDASNFFESVAVN